MSSNFLVSTATLRAVIDRSAINSGFREAFIAQLIEHGVFTEKAFPSVKLGMVIGEMTRDGKVPIGDDMNTVFNDIRDLDKLPFVRLFHLGELITLAGGRTLAEAPFVASDGMDGLRAIISYMTAAGMMTDSATKILAPSCREGLLQQHPWLADIDVSVLTRENHERWLAEQVAKYGEQHPVAALINASNPEESFSDLHRRDAKMMRSKHPLTKTTAIAMVDVGKIFVVKSDETAHILPRAEFLKLPIDDIGCWLEISEFDVNQ